MTLTERTSDIASRLVVALIYVAVAIAITWVFNQVGMHQDLTATIALLALVVAAGNGQTQAR